MPVPGASSFTYQFQPAESDIVIESFERCQIRPAAITAQHMISARRSLNLELQQWANRGPLLWKVANVAVPLIQGQSTYNVDPSIISVLDVYFQTPNGTTGFIDRIMTPISRTDYASFPDKTTPGTPTVYWFDRLNNPTITIWQPPQNGSPYQFSYYYMQRIQDASVQAGEIPDINYRFTEALCAGLAARLSEKFAPQLEGNMRLKAKQAWDEAFTEDRENAAIYIRPMLSQYWR